MLVVEDEPLLRLMAMTMMEDAGWEAMGAANADEALRLLESGRDIDVLFTDVDMPGSIDGLGLAAHVHATWPGIGIIVTSGHVMDRTMPMPSGARFFAKPYDPSEIIRTIEAFPRV